MSTVTDEMVEAACEAFVGQWDEVLLFVDWFSLRADMRSALEAAEAVRVKAEPIKGNYLVDLPRSFTITPTIPEGFIPWHGGECPVAEGTVVDYVMRDGYVIRESRAENPHWKHINANGDIIAYRIHKPADFRLEAGKFYVTASGERVGPLELGSYGWFLLTKLHLSWHEDGTCSTRPAENNLLALSSNQENNHE